MFCNEPSDVKVSKSVSPLIKIDNYHEPVEIDFTVGRDDVVVFNPDEHEFNFKKARYGELNEYLMSVDWDGLLTNCAHVDSVVDCFYDILHVGFKRFVPLKVKASNSRPPWYSKNLLNLKNRMSRAHKKFKSTGEAEHYIRFCSLQNQFDAAQARAYDSYLDETQRSLIADPSKFWAYVNTMKKTVGYHSYMRLGDVETIRTRELSVIFLPSFSRGCS